MEAEFWSKRYTTGKTGWDIGEVSRPLKEYIDQLKDPGLRILIPGAGNSYEAEYLFQKGFSEVYIIDIAREPLRNFKERCPEFPSDHILHQDFFGLRDQFDLLLEQTFFCALPPAIRMDFARQSYRLLKSGGKLTGVLFSFKRDDQGPPFGGNKEEYLTYFSSYFQVETLEPCYNSIPPRKGNELFIKVRKP